MFRTPHTLRAPGPARAPRPLHHTFAALTAALALAAVAEAQATRQVSRRSYKIIEIKRPDLRLTGGRFVLTELSPVASDGPVYPPDERAIVHTTGLVPLAPPDVGRAWICSVLRIAARGGQESALSRNPGPTLTEQPPPGIPPGAARAAGYPVSSASPAPGPGPFASR